MKIIVTGGAGFIASHIVDAYIKRGHRVSVIDNLNTGFKKNVNPKAVFYKADIRNLKTMGQIFKKERPEAVNHHAALAGVVASVGDPIPTYDVNVLGAASLLTAFSKYGKGRKKFLFASSSAIYGDVKSGFASEKIFPTYAVSKILGEELVRFYGKTQGIDYLIFRYANIFGPRQNPKGEAGVVAIFSGMILNGETPIIFGDGSKIRDYVYVSDIARANVIGLTKGSGATLNLSWGKDIKDRKIFDTVAKEFNFKKPPIYKPFRSGETMRTAIDPRLAKRVLGWKPGVTLEEGVRRCYEYLRG